MKVLELKQRMIEKLEAFRDDPKSLPALVHARYANNLPVGSAGSGTALPYRGHRLPRKHKPHQVHTQHRHSLIELLKHLILRLDIKTLECKFVNPRYNITRPLYVSEMARHTGLCERTVQRAIGTLVRAGYIARVAKHRWLYLSLNLFRDMKLNVALDAMKRQLTGLARKAEFNTMPGAAKPSSSRQSRQPTPPVPVNHPSFQPYEAPQYSKSDRETGNELLARLRRMQSGKGDPPS